MHHTTADDDVRFTDLHALSTLVLEAWGSAIDRDWSVDCVFSYALFFASGAQGAYPPFGELHAPTSADGSATTPRGGRSARPSSPPTTRGRTCWNGRAEHGCRDAPARVDARRNECGCSAGEGWH